MTVYEDLAVYPGAVITACPDCDATLSARHEGAKIEHCDDGSHIYRPAEQQDQP